MPLPIEKREAIKKKWNTYYDTTTGNLPDDQSQDEYDFWLSILDQEVSYAVERSMQEERQFILNILDGIDIADKEMGIIGGTKAIRFALASRYLLEEVTPEK